MLSHLKALLAIWLKSLPRDLGRKCITRRITTSEWLSWQMKISRKVQSGKNGLGKFCYAVIIKVSSAESRERPKGSKNLKPGSRFLSGHSLLMTVRLRQTLQPKTAKTRVSACEGLCAPPVGWVASIHPRGNETRCWPLCARLWQGAVLCLKN